VELALDRVQWRCWTFGFCKRELIGKMARGGKWVVRMADGWNWLRIVSSGGVEHYVSSISYMSLCVLSVQ
jgi:hypothetical protein